MTLHKQETITYDDGAVRDIYLFSPLKDSGELKALMLSLQNKFGAISDVIVKKYIDKHTVGLYHRYETLLEFDLADIQEFNIYEFIGKNIHYKINTFENTLDIYKFANFQE